PKLVFINFRSLPSGTRILQSSALTRTNLIVRRCGSSRAGITSTRKLRSSVHPFDVTRTKIVEGVFCSSHSVSSSSSELDCIDPSTSIAPPNVANARRRQLVICLKHHHFLRALAISEIRVTVSPLQPSFEQRLEILQRLSDSRKSVSPETKIPS